MLFQLRSFYNIECDVKMNMNGDKARFWKGTAVAYFKASLRLSTR
jgi:hypothetical protein